MRTSKPRTRCIACVCVLGPWLRRAPAPSASTSSVGVMSMALSIPEMSINRVQVILAQEQDRQSLEHGKIGGLMKGPFLYGRVAEKHATDGPIPQQLVGQRRPHADRDRIAADACTGGAAACCG